MGTVHPQGTASLSSVPGCLLVYSTKTLTRGIVPCISSTFTVSKTQVVEIMEIIMMDGDKSPKGKQAGASVCQQ